MCSDFHMETYSYALLNSKNLTHMKTEFHKSIIQVQLKNLTINFLAETRDKKNYICNNITASTKSLQYFFRNK